MRGASPDELDAWWELSRIGLFSHVIKDIPRERWTEEEEEDESGEQLIHVACQGPNKQAVITLLQSGLVNKDACTKCGFTPAHFSVRFGQCDITEILFAFCADMRKLDIMNNSVMDYALTRRYDNIGLEMVYLLLANGIRLHMIQPNHEYLIRPEMIEFEKSVLRCRTAVVAMLRVRKAAKLWPWDKFLLREIGFAIWATRYANKWQK